MIAIIAERAEWERQLPSGLFLTPSLESEGFNHASTPEQVIGSADKHYRGRSGLVLLIVDPLHLAAPLRYEGRPGGALFPHLYGPVNTDAVITVLAFPPHTDGTFSLPEGTF